MHFAIPICLHSRSTIFQIIDLWFVYAFLALQIDEVEGGVEPLAAAAAAAVAAAAAAAAVTPEVVTR